MTLSTAASKSIIDIARDSALERTAGVGKLVHVKITKVGVKNSFPDAPRHPVLGHVVFGFTSFWPIVVLRRFEAVRYQSQGRSGLGLFSTSAVLSILTISENLSRIETRNSYYEVTRLELNSKEPFFNKE